MALRVKLFLALAAAIMKQAVLVAAGKKRKGAKAYAASGPWWDGGIAPRKRYDAKRIKQYHAPHHILALGWISNNA